MKFLAIIVATLISFGAEAQTRSNVARSNTTVVASHLKNIQNRVRACTVLPYSLKSGRKVFHQLVSHCPEVKVIDKKKASIKIGSMTFQVIMVESPDSDGDLYNIVIREPISNDRYRIPNVLTFGDILLGVLVGDTQGLRQSFVSM